jgi:hypothetical protein
VLFARRLIVLFCAVCALAATPAAHAQAPPLPPPDERAAAREFSFAAYRLRVAIKAQKAAFEQRVEAGFEALNTPPCRPALRALVRLPERREDEVSGIAGAIIAAPALATVQPAFQRFQDELERVPTADPSLRSGRAGWRAFVASLAGLPAIVDVCGALEAWHRSGFARGAIPAGVRALISLEDPAPKLKRAARRMVQLGVASGTARRFTGDTLFNGFGDDIAPEPTVSPAHA